MCTRAVIAPTASSSGPATAWTHLRFELKLRAWGGYACADAQKKFVHDFVAGGQVITSTASIWLIAIASIQRGRPAPPAPAGRNQEGEDGGRRRLTNRGIVSRPPHIAMSFRCRTHPTTVPSFPAKLAR